MAELQQRFYAEAEKFIETHKDEANRRMLSTARTFPQF